MMWITDPKTKESSVSLTMLMISFVAVLVAGGLQLYGKIASVSMFPEIFYSCSALYFGRRLTIAGKAFSSDKAEEIKGAID